VPTPRERTLVLYKLVIFVHSTDVDLSKLKSKAIIVTRHSVFFHSLRVRSLCLKLRNCLMTCVGNKLFYGGLDTVFMTSRY
jgi:hypothetical protein